jgi:RNase P subunit RPR2
MGYFGYNEKEKYWAVICKGCRKMFPFALLQAKDGKFYRATVALKCPLCGEKWRYRPLESIRQSVLEGDTTPITAPLFEE